VANEQRGLVTRRQCLAARMTARAVDVRVETGRWCRVQRGVYLTLPGRDDWRTQALAALLACGPDAAWSHWTAAHVWGLMPAPCGSSRSWSPTRSRSRILSELG
jgi:hypothetical protein